MRRYVETFDRNPVLFLLPLVVLTLAGLLIAARAIATAMPYSTSATLAVNLDPTKTRPLGELPPSDYHAELLGELIESDQFLTAALERTSIGRDAPNGTITTGRLHAVREHWRHRAVGPNTVEVRYACDERGLCAEVTAAVLAQYQDEVTNARIAPKRAAVEYYERQVQDADRQLRGMSQSDAGYAAARENLDTLRLRLTNARLEDGLERQARQSELRVISPPQAPTARSSGIGAALLPLLAAVALGAALSVGMLVLATWMDTSVRTPADVFERLGVPVVGMVPHFAPAQATTAASGGGRKQLSARLGGIGARVDGRREQEHG